MFTTALFTTAKIQSNLSVHQQMNGKKKDVSHTHTMEYYSAIKKEWNLGNSLVVQWLELSTFTAKAHVQSLVWEQRFHKPCGTAQRKS